MDAWSNHLQRTETPAEARFYEYLLQQAKLLHPREAIEVFRSLLIEGNDCTYPHIKADLDSILQYGCISHDFRFILNRSCYIYINSWFQTASYRAYIPELIETFESLPTSTPHTKTEQQLRKLLVEFINSPQYKALRCLSITIQSDWEDRREKEQDTALETIIKRYPYIYKHKLLTHDSSLDQRRTVRAMQHEAQRRFDVDLSCYSAYLKFNNVIPLKASVKNPTLLKPTHLDYAIHQFAGKVDGVNTHRDLARQFLTYSQWTSSYRELKRDLYDYLAPAVHSKFGRHHFNQRLATCLSETLEYYDYDSPSDVLVAETCKKLLNFLIVESPQSPDHANFVDLIGNLGATLTVALLLKIILLCHQAKPWLERRLSILFNHYAPRPQNDVIWLVEAFENANIALSTNFGPTVL
ncbi:MAG: hypothetical protein AAF327_11205 [Cyanobacteria bacterium P01_A01_bin.37]